jgi:hypothetical protein
MSRIVIVILIHHHYEPMELIQESVPETEKNIYFWGVERWRCVRLITSPQSLNRLSRQFGILNIGLHGLLRG